MKIKLTKACWLGDKPGEANKEYDLPEKDAKTLIQLGKAVQVTTKASNKKAAE